MPRWALLLCLALGAVGIFDHELWTPDEPRVAAIAQAMSRPGGDLVPRLAGQPFVEKPPLYFAAGALAIRVLGDLVGPTASLRLTSMLWGWGTLLATFMLARRLLGRGSARLAVALLATCPGFVYVSHWILVDSALMFFAAVAAWCLAEAYTAARYRWLLPAALAACGAFWTKGFIGPALLVPAWLGAVLYGRLDRGRQAVGARVYLGWHIAAAALFVVPVVLGLAVFRKIGGEALWHEWFWENHVQRFVAPPAHLGHDHGLFYYIPALLWFMLPWIPCVVAGFAPAWAALRHRQTIRPASAMLILWALAGLALLTVSATKREIYLAPLLPVFALLGVDTLSRGGGGRPWRLFGGAWRGLCAGWLVALVFAPAYAGRVDIPSALAWRACVVAGVSLAAIAMVGLRRRRLGPPAIHGAVTAIAFVGLLLAVVPAVDRHKDLSASCEQFASAIAPARQARLAGWWLDETSVAGLDYYGGLRVPPVDAERAARILRGRDPQFDGVIASKHYAEHRDISLPPYAVVFESRLGNDRRVLQWLTPLAEPVAP